MPIDDHLEKLEDLQDSTRHIKLDEPLDSDQLKNYIILEGKLYGTYSYPDIFIALKKKHWRTSFTKTHKLLHCEGMFMLNMRQYVDLLNLLESRSVFYGDGTKVPQEIRQRLLNNIIDPQELSRGEWVDIVFSRKDREELITYHQFLENRLIKKTEEIDPETLIAVRKPKLIDLLDWLRNSTHQGFPRADVTVGKVGYYYPCTIGSPSKARIICADSYYKRQEIHLQIGNPRISVSWMAVRPGKLKV